MPHDLTLISVRLDRGTLDLLDKLQHDQTRLVLRQERERIHSPFKRSELIRHAITAGLDVLTKPLNAKP